MLLVSLQMCLVCELFVTIITLSGETMAVNVCFVYTQMCFNCVVYVTNAHSGENTTVNGVFVSHQII